MMLVNLGLGHVICVVFIDVIVFSVHHVSACVRNKFKNYSTISSGFTYFFQFFKLFQCTSTKTSGTKSRTTDIFK